MVSQYQNLVVRGGKGKSHLVPVPLEETPKPKPRIETTGKPPQIRKGGLGPVQWSGTALEAIKAVALYTGGLMTLAAQSEAVSQVGVPAQFAIYDSGKRIEVYFAEGSTEVSGKAEVAFQTAGGDTLRAPLFIVKPTP